MATNLVLTGKFLGAKPTQFVGQNNYAIRVFYLDITDNPEYPNTPEFQLKGDKVNLVDNLQRGQTITVKFNIDGRKYTNRENKAGVITNLNVWKIDVVTTQSAAVATAAPTQAAPRQPAPAPAPVAPAISGSQSSLGGFGDINGDDDLPF